jgi:putative ABC transport system substrate-binding protein
VRRREFITLLGGAAAAWPVAARAQQRERMRRIGVLMNLTADDPQSTLRVAAFAQGLERLGWTLGGNVQIDYRWGAGNLERIGGFAADLVALAPDVILTTGALTGRTIATGKPHRADRIRGNHRSGWRRICGEHGAAWRQHHWLYHF